MEGVPVMMPYDAAAILEKLVSRWGIGLDTLPVGRIEFAPLGTELFDTIAAEVLPDLDAEGFPDEQSEACWDPMFCDVADALSASSAPRATMAGKIERNVLYASESAALERRLDSILMADIERTIATVRAHREKMEAIISPRTEALLASWQQDLVGGDQ